MKPRGRQVMQFMGEKKKKKKEKKPVLSSYTGAFIIHCDLPGMCWQTQSVLCDIVPVNWSDCCSQRCFLTAGHHLLEAAKTVPAAPGAARGGLEAGRMMHHPFESNLGSRKKTKQCSDLILKPAAASIRHRRLSAREGCWKGGGWCCAGTRWSWGRPLKNVLSAGVAGRHGCAGTAQPPPGRWRGKKECITKRTKYISKLHWAFLYFPGMKIHLCICWPKGGSIRSTTSRFAAFAAAAVVVVLAAVSWYLLRPPGPNISYIFLENFRVNHTLILGAFYGGKKNEAFIPDTGISGDLHWNL